MNAPRAICRNRPQNTQRLLLIICMLGGILLACPTPPGAVRPAVPSQLPPILGAVEFTQQLGEQIPLDLVFRDEAGESVRLGQYFDTQPVILTMAYYACPMLCGVVLDGLSHSLRLLPLTLGEQFTVVTVSIDARDTPAQAAAKKAKSLRGYTRPGADLGWHFLTGDEASIQQLTHAVGFQYAYDPETAQFAHAAGLVVLAPGGTIARYLYGVEFPPRDVRLALVEAAAGRVGSAVDRLLLFCYQYDPTTGKYGLVIMNVLRLASLATMAALGGFMIVMFRRERLRVDDRR